MLGTDLKHADLKHGGSGRVTYNRGDLKHARPLGSQLSRRYRPYPYPVRCPLRTSFGHLPARSVPRSPEGTARIHTRSDARYELASVTRPIGPKDPAARREWCPRS